VTDLLEPAPIGLLDLDGASEQALALDIL